MKVNVEQLSADAVERLEDACVADGLAHNLPEAVRPAAAGWGPTEAGRLLADQWHSIWDTYQADLYALRDRLGNKASRLAQSAADFAEAEIEVEAAIVSVDQTETVQSTGTYVVLPGGDGFTPDYRDSQTAGGVVAQLIPEPSDPSRARSDLEAFTTDNLTLLEEAELLLKRHYGEELGFRQPTGYLSDLTATDPAGVTSHVELTDVAISLLDAIGSGLDTQSESLPHYWESDAASAYLDVTADSRNRLSALAEALTSSRDKGTAAAGLLDDLLLRSVQSATSPRADGQSHIQRIRQAVERIQDLDADQRSYDSRSGWEAVDPGADLELLDVAFRGLWQRARGLSHSWSQCADQIHDEAQAIGLGDVSPLVAPPAQTGFGADSPGSGLDTISDT